MNHASSKYFALLGASVLMAASAPGFSADNSVSSTLSKPAAASVVPLPPGKLAYTVTLPSVVDPDLVGQHVDVYERRVTNDSRVEDYNLVLNNVLVLSCSQPSADVAVADIPKQATLALDDKEMKRIRKYERPGHDIILRLPAGKGGIPKTP